jgi:hypothetical protein
MIRQGSVDNKMSHAHNKGLKNGSVHLHDSRQLFKPLIKLSEKQLCQKEEHKQALTEAIFFFCQKWPPAAIFEIKFCLHFSPFQIKTHDSFFFKMAVS